VVWSIRYDGFLPAAKHGRLCEGRAATMKYAILIPNGAPDEPLEALGGRTPLQAASLPTLDSLAEQGRLGTAATGPGEELPTEAAAHFGVLGYAPELCQAGEGALSADVRGLDIGPKDEVFCCNLITVIDGYLRDFTAGFIGPTEAASLIDALTDAFGSEGFRFHACGGYRNLCVWENVGPAPRLQTTPPDRILDQPIRRHMPRGDLSRPLYALMLRAEALLREHDVNLVRQDLGENPASAIWLWGHGPLPVVPSFYERYGVRGALIAGSDVICGIGRSIGWERPDVSGATGLPDTAYAAKGQAAVAAVDSFDLVCVQVQAPHTLGMLGRVPDKVSALEAIDGQIVAPLLKRLQAEPEWRMLVIPAQADRAAHHPGLAGRTLFILAGSGIESNRGDAFDEENAVAGEMHPERASDLMEYFLHR
jgi:2,3-bisphosphoglycerate-independent phosphoglycerate mutase